MNKKITVNVALAIAIIAMTLTFVVTMILSMQIFNRMINVREKEVMYNKLSEMDKSARENYYGEIVNDTLYDYIAAGYVAGMGDADARYYTARQYLEYLNLQNGVLMGIGADVAKDANGYARITRVYSNSPAEEFGLTANTFITQIGETDVRTLSLSQINSQLLGESGTVISLNVVNATGDDARTVELQRREYEIPSVDAQLLSDNATLYVHISTFNSRTLDELKEYLDEWVTDTAAPDGIIFDVRDNADGSIANAIRVIDHLCPVGTIASQQNRDGSVTTLETSDINEVDLPMVVLVNGNTSYAAELFATSLREFEKGRIVGVRTAGKGTVQCRPVALSDGSAFSYTVGLLLSKSGTSFNGTGVVPDVEALLTAEEEANFYSFTVETDPQIRRAREALDTMLGRNEIELNRAPASSGASSTASEPSGSASSGASSADQSSSGSASSGSASSGASSADQSSSGSASSRSASSRSASSGSSSSGTDSSAPADTSSPPEPEV